MWDTHESAGDVLERAAKIYNANANVATLEQAKAIVKSLELFVKAYQLDVEDRGDDSLESASMMTSNILKYIALCNYKIDNVNRAYCIAKQGLDAVDYAIENSSITGFDRSFYGADTLEELIRIIESSEFDRVEDADRYDEIDPEEIDTERFEELIGGYGNTSGAGAKPSKEQIKGLIDAINKCQELITKVSEETSDFAKGFQIRQSLEVFKFPLYYAWRGYGYGWHTDFCEEGDSLFQFMMFEVEMQGITKDMVTLLNEQSPFTKFERNSAITNGLIDVYTVFLKDLNNGKFKF